MCVLFLVQSGGVNLNEKSDVVDIKLGESHSSANVFVYYDSCNSANILTPINGGNAASGTGEQIYSFDLATDLGTNLVDNTTYRFFASQTKDGFDSGCTTLSNASYHYNSSPIVTAVEVGTNPIIKPTLTIKELIVGDPLEDPRSFKVYAVPDDQDLCSGDATLLLMEQLALLQQEQIPRKQRSKMDL